MGPLAIDITDIGMETISKRKQMPGVVPIRHHTGVLSRSCRLLRASFHAAKISHLLLST